MRYNDINELYLIFISLNSCVFNDISIIQKNNFKVDFNNV